jgi:MerR family transcriptional regulator/heat shock protein HspR
MPDTTVRDELNDPVISIGVLAVKVGLSVSTVRKYEKDGLLIAHRTSSRHRLFSHEDISRVRNIHHMIQELGLNTQAIRRMQALLPCWDLAPLPPCNEETRKDCPAYKDNTRPCWAIKGLECASQGNECRRCVVYRFGSLCTQDIKRLLHTHTDLEQKRSAITELILRRRQSPEKES